MHLGAANVDVFLPKGVGYDVNVMSHVCQSVGHLADASGRSMIGGKRARRDHDDGITVRPTAKIQSGACHLAVVTGVAGATGITGFLR